MSQLYYLNETNVLFNENFVLDSSNNIYRSRGLQIIKTDVNDIDTVIMDATTNGLYYNTVLYPAGLTIDHIRNVYFVDNATYSIYKIDATTLISTKIVGTGNPGAITEGIALNSSFVNILGNIQVDFLQYVYILDTATFTIAKISNDNISILLNQSNGIGFPTCIKLDYNKTNLYIADKTTYQSPNTLFKQYNINTENMTTLYTLNNVSINDIAQDHLDNIYFTDNTSFTVKKIDKNGIITVIAGTGVKGIPRILDLSVYSNLNDPKYIQTTNIGAAPIYFTDHTSLLNLSYAYICFLEDTKILTNKGYLPIQSLRKGDLIQTLKHGYVPIDIIGYSEMDHVATDKRIKDQLYKCTSEHFPEVFEDLIITGCHSILVENSTNVVNEEQIEMVKEVNGGIFLTDDMLRLPACVDKRTTVYEKAGKYNIYHITLEHEDNYMNYGIYANGLLVESISKRNITEFCGPTFKILN